MLFRQPPDFLLISQAAAAAFAAARLLHFGMRQRFRFLLFYLIVVAVCCAALSVLDYYSQPYFWTYLTVSPVLWCAAVLSVWEMFALVFRDYPALRTAGRWALYIALAVSVIAALLLVRAPWAGESPHSRMIFYEISFDRSLQFGLAAIIAILMIFLSRYPLHLSRNTYVSSGFFSAIFLVQAVVRLVDSASPNLRAHFADYQEVVFSALCLLGWGALLGPTKVVAPVQKTVDKPKEAALLHQLEAMNSILSRSSRR